MTNPVPPRLSAITAACIAYAQSLGMPWPATMAPDSPSPESAADVEAALAVMHKMGADAMHLHDTLHIAEISADMEAQGFPAPIAHAIAPKIWAEHRAEARADATATADSDEEAPSRIGFVRSTAEAAAVTRKKLN